MLLMADLLPDTDFFDNLWLRLMHFVQSEAFVGMFGVVFISPGSLLNRTSDWTNFAWFLCFGVAASECWCQ